MQKEWDFNFFKEKTNKKQTLANRLWTLASDMTFFAFLFYSVPAVILGITGNMSINYFPILLFGIMGLIFDNFKIKTMNNRINNLY